jgi:hypothetical protein
MTFAMTLKDEALAEFERIGPDQLRNLLMSGGLPTAWTQPASEYLAIIDKAEREKRATSARRTELAAWIAAATGVLALVVAILTAH